MSNPNYSNHIQNIQRLDELRLKVNEIMHSSQVSDNSGLISLNDLLRQHDTDRMVSRPEQYLMISNILEAGGEEDEDKYR